MRIGKSVKRGVEKCVEGSEKRGVGKVCWGVREVRKDVGRGVKGVLGMWRMAGNVEKGVGKCVGVWGRW